MRFALQEKNLASISAFAVAILIALSTPAYSQTGDEAKLDASRAYADLLSLVNIGEHRRTGTPNERKTVNFIEARLKDAGLDPVRDSFADDIFVYDEAWVQVGEGDDAWRPPVFPLFYTGTTGKSSVGAPLAFIGRGSPEELEGIELKGKIVVIELTGERFKELPVAMPWNVRGIYENLTNPIPTNIREPYAAAVAAEAAGFIGVVSFGFKNAHYGMNTFEFDGEMKLPGLMVPAEDGARLLQMIADSPNLEISMKLDARIERRAMHNVTARITGQGSDIVLLNSAHTAWFTGAVERAGSAGAIEIARYVNALPLEKRRNTLLVSFCTGHELGWLGTKRLMNPKKADVQNMIAFVNIGSSIAGNGWIKENNTWQPTGRGFPNFAFVSPNVRMEEITKRAIAGNNLDLTSVYSTDFMNPGEGRFAKPLGIPATAIIASPPYYHSSLDVPEHLQLADYARALGAYAQIITELLMEDGQALKDLERR